MLDLVLTPDQKSNLINLWLERNIGKIEKGLACCFKTVNRLGPLFRQYQAES